jgi:hypothetical protein
VNICARVESLSFKKAFFWKRIAVRPKKTVRNFVVLDRVFLATLVIYGLIVYEKTFDIAWAQGNGG